MSSRWLRCVLAWEWWRDHLPEYIGAMIAVSIMIAFFTGIGMAFYTNNVDWFAMAAVALILIMAGG